MLKCLGKVTNNRLKFEKTYSKLSSHTSETAMVWRTGSAKRQTLVPSSGSKLGALLLQSLEKPSIFQTNKKGSSDVFLLSHFRSLSTLAGECFRNVCARVHAVST